MATYELTVLSPVHIGSGIKLGRLDYLYDRKSNKLKVLDSDRFIKLIALRKYYDNYLNYVSTKGSRGELAQWIEGKGLYSYIDTCIAYTIDVSTCPDFRNANDINTFIKNVYGEPYIPGSSLKGAIVSALIDYKLKGNPNAYYKDNFALFDSTFGKSDQFYNVLPYIQVGDSLPLPKESIALSKKIDHNSLTGINSQIALFRETIAAGTTVNITINLRQESGLSYDDLEKAIRLRFNNIYGEKEGVISKHYRKTMVFLPDDLDFAENNIVLGGGTGFHTKTNLKAIYGDTRIANEKAKATLAQKFKGKKHEFNSSISPRALKLVPINSTHKLMGICQLKRID